MKRSRFLSFLLAVAAGFSAGLPIASLSDDTEVYVGSEELAEVQGVRPNVLIILDTSGSMSTLVPGTGKDRLDNMKEALQSILDGLNNVNVGLMRFSNPGGPILFPIAYIDADASEAFNAGGADISARIVDGSDDVEELRSTGEMNFASTRLELVDTPAFGPETTLAQSVGASADDAEEIVVAGSRAVGHLNLTSSELEMVTDSEGARIDGLVFRNLAIPNSAYVLGADLQFTAAQSDAGEASLEFRGWAIDDAGTFSSTLKPSSTARTNSVLVMSGLAPWTSGRVYATDDLSPMVQEIVDRPGWASGNDLGVLVTGTGLRQAKSYDSGGAAARLSVTYGSGSPGEQRVGLRFRSLGIPQGATIDSAALELSPSRTLGGLVMYRIHGEDVADAEPFDASTQTVTKKLERKTDASVDWTAATEWTARSAQGQVQASPDLAPILQEIVNRSDWCGGNDVALLVEKLSGSAWRAVYSYDGDPNYAPVLKVNYTYDPATAPAGTGCVVQTLQRQVKVGTDDAEQTNNTAGTMTLGGSVLDMPFAGSTSQTVAVRFQDVRLDRGVEILDARLVFTAYGGNSGDTSMILYGEAADNAATYGATGKDLSNRTKTATSVTWNSASAGSPLTAWVTNGSYASPNLNAIVQEVIDRAGWQSGNALSFIVTPGNGQRRGRSYENSPAQSPVLQITYRGRLSATSSSSVTVRQLLKQTVSGLDHGGWTPIVDTLYEAARFYRGEGAYWGKTRGGDGSDVERSTRVSHPASYTGGTVVRDDGCTDANLSAEACRTERIEGEARYISPIQDLCGSNYIILLTDGEANNNHSASLVRSMASLTSCQTTLSDNTSVISGEQCGIDLGRFLYTKDQSGALAGSQAIATYTIGFNLDATDPAQVHAIQFLKDLAKESGGQFRPASTAAELAATFEAFFLDILNRSTSYAAPALSVNAFNKLYHRDDVYFSLFQPSDRIRWIGNVKKYRLCQSTADGCVLGQVLDSQGSSAIAADNRISDSAWSYWSGGADGARIKDGGAGNAGPASGDRRVITFTGATPPAGAPFEDLSQAGHRVLDSNSSLTGTMLGLDAAADATARTDLIAWVRGVDKDDEDEDGDTVEDRYSFGDPLHSSPQAVTYGGTDTAPVTKLFVGTNDGGLRMIDAYDGEEEWIFYPPETLSRQANLRANPNGQHIYGIDGTPTVWLKDGDGDGTVGDSSGDFVRVFVGMRRGGNHYYALDVTPDSPLSTQGEIRPVYPKYMWRIDGGSADYPQLGQTWSRPVVTTVRVGTSTPGQSEAQEVLIFAGGYDESQDTAFGASTLGNAIYIADPLTGARKYWISGTAHSTGAGVQVPDMSYPIPSDLAFLDSNGDGATDRIYVGDTGGQLWRIDLAPASGTAGGVKAVVGKLATVSSSASEADKRKFFYPPDVVQVLDSKYSDIARYDLVTIASGDREHPLSEAVTDRLYAFRDLDYGPMVDANGNGLPEGYPRASGVALQGRLDGPPAVAGDLFDATDVPQIEAGGSTNLTALKGARGWYMRLEGLGEKGLASPVVLAGKLFITTFTPQATQLGDVCQLMEGGGRLYGLDVLSAQPKFNWDEVGDITSKADRTYQLAAGIPSGAVPIFQEEGVTLLIGVGGGAETVDPNIALPRARTYWFQEQ